MNMEKFTYENSRNQKNKLIKLTEKINTWIFKDRNNLINIFPLHSYRPFSQTHSIKINCEFGFQVSNEFGEVKQRSV